MLRGAGGGQGAPETVVASRQPEEVPAQQEEKDKERAEEEEKKGEEQEELKIDMENDFSVFYLTT